MAFWRMKRSSGEKERWKEEKSEEAARSLHFSSIFENAVSSPAFLQLIEKNIQINLQDISQYYLLIAMFFYSSTIIDLDIFLTPIWHGPCQSGLEMAANPAAVMITAFWNHWTRSLWISYIHMPDPFIQTEISQLVWRWICYAVVDTYIQMKHLHVSF